MNIGVACGGTGGHIFPGLVTAQELSRRGHDVTLWLAGKDVESTVVEGWKGHVVTVPSAGFGSRNPIRILGTLWRILCAIRACRRMMRQNRPDVMLAMGSYASVGPVIAAHQEKIPIILHEANVVPGRAVTFLSRWASTVAVGFEETRAHLNHPQMVFTGMPVRRAEPVTHSNPAWDWTPGTFTILVMGGSRGAHKLNELASHTVVQLHRAGQVIRIIHLTGVKDEAATRDAYAQAGVPHQVFGFLHDMDRAYRLTTLAICRSGASTCAELSRYGIPSLLVPYPFAIHQHQMANARAMEKTGAADVLAESDMTVNGLVDYIRTKMADSGALQRMGEAARRRFAGDPAALLADLVERS